jgi:hypothetical protein
LERTLKEKLNILEAELGSNDSINDEYESIKSEYESIQKHKTSGAMIRSRAKYIEQGERNTNFFL